MGGVPLRAGLAHVYCLSAFQAASSCGAEAAYTVTDPMPPDTAFRLDWFMVMCSAIQDNKADSGQETDRERETRPAAETGLAGKTNRGGAGLLKRLRRLVVLVVATYVAVCFAVAFFQAQLIYFPTRGYEQTPGDVGIPFETLRLDTADGETIVGWFVPRSGADATVLFFHGNAGNMSDRVYDARVLHDLGFNVLMIDYRGYGESTGSPSEKGLYKDAETAWTYLTETRGVPADRIVLFGRSLGGGVAIELARRHEPAALVVESTFTRLADVGSHHYSFLPVSLIVTQRFDSESKIPDIACPKLILHGKDDQLIPIALGRRLFDAAKEPKRFIETPGGHNNSGFTYTNEYTQQLADFVNEALSSSAP